MTMMVEWTVIDPRGVTHPAVIDPAIEHVCIWCDVVADENAPTFDMHYCEVSAGWVHTDCHPDTGCRDPLCDPNYPH